MHITTVEIPEFPHRIKVSNSQRPKYFRKGQKLPKKYQSSKYTYKSFTLRGKTQQLLVHRGSGKRVIANPIATNNAKFLVIRGNDFYSGSLHYKVREKVVGAIKAHFKPYVKMVPKLDFPVQIYAELHMPYKLPRTNDGDWDVGNMMWIYGKVFEDTLTACHKYEDDKVINVTHPPFGGLFVPVETYEQRKLVYHIHKDDRPEIIQKYKKFYE